MIHRCLLALAIAPVVEHEVCDAEEERTSLAVLRLLLNPADTYRLFNLAGLADGVHTLRIIPLDEFDPLLYL